MGFNTGDLLVCVDNTVLNEHWHGTPPTIGDYYTWAGDHPFCDDCGFVWEIKASISAPHSAAWYEKVQDVGELGELIHELETIEEHENVS